MVRPWAVSSIPIPAISVHGSWDHWAGVFDQAGYSALTPGWTDDPRTVAEANAHPEVFANKTVGQVADHFEAIIRQLARKPIIVGHSFGGLLVQILAGRALAAASVAIDPAPFRGVLPLPLSALRSAWPVLGNPANRHRAVSLTFEQFRFAFANAVSEEEARELYETFAVPASGAPIFQAAAANLNPWSDARVDTDNPKRGPLLIISGAKDNTVPWAVANASYHRPTSRKAWKSPTGAMPSSWKRLAGSGRHLAAGPAARAARGGQPRLTTAYRCSVASRACVWSTMGKG